jgi:hypothetical protein
MLGLKRKIRQSFVLAEAQNEWAVSEASSIPFERKNKTQVVDANVFRVKNVKAGG